MVSQDGKSVRLSDPVTVGYFVIGVRYCGSFADGLDKAKVWTNPQMLMTPTVQALP